VVSKDSQLNKTPRPNKTPIIPEINLFAEDGDKDKDGYDEDDSGGFIVDYDYDIDNIHNEKVIDEDDDDDDDDDGGFIIGYDEDEDEDEVAAEDEYGDDEDGDEDGGFIIDDEEDGDEDGGFIIDDEEDGDEEDGDAPDENKGMNRCWRQPYNLGQRRHKTKRVSYKKSQLFFSLALKAGNPVILKKGREYDAYARACPANLNKQPVILTDEEKRHIDETSPFI
jgi:hypothetical protein